MVKSLRYEELRAQQKAEKEASLAKLSADFYEMALKRVEDLQGERDRAYDQDPNSKSLRMVDDELRSTKTILGRIVDRRLMKILQLALVGSKSGDRFRIEEENMTTAEKRVYRGTLEVLKSFRNDLAGAAEGKGLAEGKEEGKGLAEGKEEGKGLAEGKEEAKRKMVLVTQDVPPFVGPDGTRYSLKEGDVASLPSIVVELLVKEKKCTLIE
jgi:hypothetical protein